LKYRQFTNGLATLPDLIREPVPDRWDKGLAPKRSTLRAVSSFLPAFSSHQSTAQLVFADRAH
jgi:hypothetical protein